MPNDADIVRCASPWPALAAQLLESLGQLGAGYWSLERICQATPAAFSAGDAEQILGGLAATGLCVQSAEGHWSATINQAETIRVATLLRGAEHFRRLRVDAPNLELAVTMPMSPSQLEQQLLGAPGRPGGYLPTPQAFARIAATARNRLVVMTPFLDRMGFAWLRGVFQAANQSVERVVILRDAAKYAVDISVHHADWLRNPRVRVFDYNLAHGSENDRRLPMETFHSKVVLADDALAYVGSANMLGSGAGTSLELGVIVDGKAAAQVARLLNAVLVIAHEL